MMLNCYLTDNIYKDPIPSWVPLVSKRILDQLFEESYIIKKKYLDFLLIKNVVFDFRAATAHFDAKQRNHLFY